MMIHCSKLRTNFLRAFFVKSSTMGIRKFASFLSVALIIKIQLYNLKSYILLIYHQAYISPVICYFLVSYLVTSKTINNTHKSPQFTAWYIIIHCILCRFLSNHRSCAQSSVHQRSLPLQL